MLYLQKKICWNEESPRKTHAINAPLILNRFYTHSGTVLLSIRFGTWTSTGLTETKLLWEHLKTLWNWFSKNPACLSSLQSLLGFYGPSETSSGWILMHSPWIGLWSKQGDTYNLSLHKPTPQTRMKQTRTARERWTAPDRNGYKTNFDGAMFHDSGEVGLGVVIRNDEGEVMAALSGKKSHCHPLLLSWNY